MALPVLNNPNYEMELPSTGEKIEFRPFLVKEQKILMMAMESEDTSSQAKAVIDIIKNCTFGKLDDMIEVLPTYDIEYMFLQIRQKSVGETVDITVTCPDDGETKVPVTINLEDISIVRTEGHTNTVMITDKIGMTMRHPTMKQILSYDLTKMDTMESTFGIIQDCLENIFDENEVYDDMNKKELSEFIEQMTTGQFEKVTEFFTTMPKLKHTVKVTNPNTGVENDIVLEGMQSFLG
tara:strand:+ start:1310 stop:2020 length:711 start_codon:yes stop_codon:yes gene_type:complete